MINRKNLGGLNNRMNKSATNGGNGGSNFSVMDWSKTGKGKDELKFFKPQEGKNIIDIIPYEIKTKNHPMVRSGEAKVGDADYVIEVWQHSNIGPSQKTVLCLNRMYGKACPICEAAQALRKGGKEEQAKKLYAKQRAFYNVVDSNDPDMVKVFDVSYKLFEKELIDEAKDGEDGFVNFADPDEGSSVKFKASKKSGGDFTFLEFKSFAFLDRDESISDEILEQAISFDELLKIPTYDEVEAIYTGNDSDEDDDDDEAPSKEGKFYDEDEDEQPKSKKRHHDEDEDEDEVPSKKPNRHRDEDDGDEQPKSKKQSFDDMDDVEESPKHKCPCGHHFGDDNDEYPEDCEDCKIWQKCCDAQEK